MGVGELNNCYEDAELADTIVAVGTNALETQTNYFLNHWVPNLRGATLDKKKKLMPNEEHAAARIIIIDPRRTVTVNACEVEAGKENVLHLAINSGTDLALFNALFTYIADKGWTQTDFIEKSTLRTAQNRPPLYPARGDSPAVPGHLTSFEGAREGCRTSIDDAAKITGLNPADIVKAAEWIGMPKERRQAPPRDVRIREGPDLGKRQLPHQRRNGEHCARHGQCRSTGRRRRSPRRPPGRLCASRLSRPASRALRRPASDRRKGRRPPHLGLRPLQDHPERRQVQAGLQETHRQGEGRDVGRLLWRPEGDGRRDPGGDQGGRALRGRRRHRPDQDRTGLPRVAAGGDGGRNEPHFDERRAPVAPDRALYGPARPVHGRIA